MSTPLVSVVIPVYQGERFISATLDSVLAQTSPNLEIIVVDDGSVDATALCVAPYASRGVRYLHLSNGGATRARNAGYRASTGEFVQFLDHDDLLDAHKIEAQMRRLLSGPAGAVACGMWKTFDDNLALAESNDLTIYRDDDPLPWLCSVRGGEGMMPTGAWLTPRALIESAGEWDESLERNPDDDGEFFSRVILASRRVLHCADAVFYYRNPTSTHNVRAGRSEKAIRSLFRTQEIYRDRLLAAEDSLRTRRAAAFGFATFLEMLYPAAPEQCAASFRAIESLDARGYRLPGSPQFRFMSRALGLRRALALRHLMRSVRSTLSVVGSRIARRRLSLA